jgi:trk system potassium uptake protein TrkA
VRLAQEIFAPDVHTRMRLSTGQEVVEVVAHRSLVGKTIADLNFRQKYRLNIIAIKRLRAGFEPSDPSQDAWEVLRLPAPSDALQSGDVLVLIGDADMVQTFLEL